VTEARDAELAEAFPDVSPHARRAALLQSGVALDPLVEGVRQDSYEHLEASLAALLELYQGAERVRRGSIRAVVITAREHAELATRNHRTGPAKRAEKTEMSLWLRIWLENPPLFPQWVELRRQARPPV